MKKEILFSLDTPYRQRFEVAGYRFGSGKKSCAIVGALRGNEVQQMYICSQIVKTLTRLEAEGGLVRGREILVVPCVNHFSMNVGSRFWAMDHTDINRMFPGYDQGETTQRIAAELFGQLQGYRNGIQLASFYLPGAFVPHVRIMDTGYGNSSQGDLFGLPYLVKRRPAPIDTTTLNYNWQLWDTSAYSLYTAETDQIDEPSARQTVDAILRFLARTGAIRWNCHAGLSTTTLAEETLVSVHTHCGGILRRRKNPGDEVEAGEVLAEILDPFTGEVKEQLESPVEGIIFFAIRKPLTNQHEIAFRIIPHIHA